MNVSIENGEKEKVRVCSSARKRALDSLRSTFSKAERTEKKLFSSRLTTHQPSKQLSGSIKRTFETIGGDVNSIPFQVSNAEPIDSDQEHEPKRRKVEDGKPGIKRGRWDKHEHSLFVKGLQIYGRQWKLIAEMVRLFFFLLFVVVRIAFEKFI